MIHFRFSFSWLTFFSVYFCYSDSLCFPLSFFCLDFYVSLYCCDSFYVPFSLPVLLSFLVFLPSLSSFFILYCSFYVFAVLTHTTFFFPPFLKICYWSCCPFLYLFPTLIHFTFFFYCFLSYFSGLFCLFFLYMFFALIHLILFFSFSCLAFLFCVCLLLWFTSAYIFFFLSCFSCLHWFTILIHFASVPSFPLFLVVLSYLLTTTCLLFWLTSQSFLCSLLFRFSLLCWVFFCICLMFWFLDSFFFFFGLPVSLCICLLIWLTKPSFFFFLSYFFFPICSLNHSKILFLFLSFFVFSFFLCFFVLLYVYYTDLFCHPFPVALTFHSILFFLLSFSISVFYSASLNTFAFHFLTLLPSSVLVFCSNALRLYFPFFFPVFFFYFCLKFWFISLFSCFSCFSFTSPFLFYSFLSFFSRLPYFSFLYLGTILSHLFSYICTFLSCLWKSFYLVPVYSFDLPRHLFSVTYFILLVYLLFL